MLEIGINIKMITSVGELPAITPKDLFLDVETTSADPKEFGTYPWRGDRMCGFSFTWDDHPVVYYIPLRHQHSNVDLEGVIRWLDDILSKTGDWVNHNIKFDAIFLAADGIDVVDKSVRLVDTLTMAKTYDTDRTNFGLKNLCRDWLNLPMDEELEIKAYLKEIKSKSYGELPPDMCGRYACMDVIGNRKLYRRLQAEQPAEYVKFWETEIRLTKTLLWTELKGFQMDLLGIKKEAYHTLKKTIDLSSKLSDISGREFSNSSAWVYDVLINQLGLPVLARNEKTGNPTFNKKALKTYLGFPQVAVSQSTTELIKTLETYRKESQYKSLFLDPFQELGQYDNRIHPVYNQLLRTSRMSCRGPNIQQQNSRSKLLFRPEPGRCFISCDYSQIEFRIIAHYSQDADVIRAYNEDPDTDFHTLTATFIYSITLDQVKKKHRSPAKTMNFGMGFGMGRAKAVRNVATDSMIIDEINDILDDNNVRDPKERAKLFEVMSSERANMVFNTYHERMPGIRRTSSSAAETARARGYVFNAYGRRRHLPVKACFKAFNSVVQGTAMDIIKERMVATSHVYDPWFRGNDIRIVANVHDEILYDAPVELMLDTAVHTEICNRLESPSVTFRVPIRVGLGVSKNSWAEAAGEDTIKVDGKVVGGKIR
jgi:DNA polymerase-1